MISDKENVRISKFLSLVLRHQPQTVGIQLDENGWTDVNVLLEQLGKNDFAISQEILEYVVESNSKKRFAFNMDKTRIRANQGHSVDVELGYDAKEPPATLYHGTAEASLSSILKIGLIKGKRHHVHLSADTETAIKVGQRHGTPVVLVVDSKAMYEDGFAFFISENKVWLTDHVLPKYLKKM